MKDVDEWITVRQLHKKGMEVEVSTKEKNGPPSKDDRSNHK